MARKCKVCSSGHMIVKEGTRYGVCNICNAIEILYVPQPHQAEFHKDPHLFKGLFGAYGSGKTTTAVMSVVQHILSVPFGQTAMLAPTMQILKETSYRELKKYLPEPLIEKEYTTRGAEKIVMKNGHELLLLPSNDADKIRSLNLTCFYLEEASNADFSVYIELTARLRNDRAFEYEVDKEGKVVTYFDADQQVTRKKIKKNHLLGIVCSNPDSGWIRKEILYKSDKVYSTVRYPRDPQYNPFLSTHLHTSFQNKYLDPDFQTRLSRGKPEWWIKRYIYGSFEYAEGLVYPTFMENVVEQFPVPKNWKRMFGVDFGLRDPTVMVALAIDPETGVCYVYDEHYEAEKPVSYHAQKMLAMVNKVPAGMINGQIVADPAGKSRRGTNGKSYFGHYAEYGLWFKDGINAIESGIMKVFTYLALGKLKIMDNCFNTIREGREYKYPEGEVSLEKNRGETPIDANNHAMDSLRYIIQELPDDPERVVTEVYFRDKKALEGTRNYNFPPALREDSEPQDISWYGTF